MSNLIYEQFDIRDDYFEFTLHPKRFRSFRLHLGEEEMPDTFREVHFFDIVWFRGTEELIAAEIERSFGTILPLDFRLKKSTGKYLYLGNFTEKEIDDLLPFRGHIIKHLWALYTQDKGKSVKGDSNGQPGTGHNQEHSNSISA